MSKACTAQVKQHNVRLLLDALRTLDTATKQDLVDRTSLSTATCTVLLGELIAQGQALELAHATPKGGRPARQFALNAGYAHILCVYLDKWQESQRMLYCTYDLKGKPLRASLAAHTRLDALLLRDTLQALVAEDPLCRIISIGVPGRVRDGAVTGCDLLGPGTIALRAYLQESLPQQIIIENDMAVTAYGVRPQAATGDVMAITWPWNSLPRAGIVSEGGVLRGHTCFAGDLSAFPFPYSKTEQLHRYRSEEHFLPMAAQVLASVICLLNPGVIAITGEAALRYTPADFARACQDTIPSQHLPVFLLLDDVESANFTGLFHLAMDTSQPLA